jgi:outer membrane protein assembly factor BamB
MVNAETGTVIGSFNSRVPPAVGTRNGYFLQGGTLVCQSLDNGQTIWSFSGDGNLNTSPILVNNTVFVGSIMGNLYGIDATTGNQVWIMNFGPLNYIPDGAGWDAQLPYSGLSAGDGLLVVPAGDTLTAYVLYSPTP